MDHTPSRSPPGPLRQPRSPALWARIRAEYTAGATAAEVCARYRIGRSTLRDRAKAEGWRRADLPELKPAPLPSGDAAARVEDLTALAWAQAEQAIRAGRLYAARGWARLAKDLLAMSAQGMELSLALGEKPQPFRLPPWSPPPESVDLDALDDLDALSDEAAASLFVRIGDELLSLKARGHPDPAREQALAEPTLRLAQKLTRPGGPGLPRGRKPRPDSPVSRDPGAGPSVQTGEGREAAKNPAGSKPCEITPPMEPDSPDLPDPICPPPDSNVHGPQIRQL